MQATRLPAERLAQMYPGVDLASAQERFLTRYRALNTGIAALGLLLLAWLFNYMQRPNWDDGPVKVLLTVYFFVALMVPLGLVIWLGVRQHPFPGFAGLINIAGITLVYAVNALVIYVMLYGRNRHPLVTHADRLHAIGVTVKSCVYSCIVIVVYLSLNLALGLLDLQRWEPFALSVFFIICALLTSMGVMAPPRRAAVVV